MRVNMFCIGYLFWCEMKNETIGCTKIDLGKKVDWASGPVESPPSGGELIRAPPVALKLISTGSVAPNKLLPTGRIHCGKAAINCALRDLT
jgi:hypothetical protein